MHIGEIMSTQSTTQTPKYTVVHRNWRDYRESEYSYSKLNLDSRNSRQLEAYHALAERLLATGDWITSEDQEIPELFANQDLETTNENNLVPLERIHPNGIFSAQNHVYNLILMRHYFKNGQLQEFSISLPISNIKDGFSVVVYTAIDTRGYKLSLDEVVTDLDGIISKINNLYKQHAASVDGMVYNTPIKHMPIDYDLLKERFLLKRVDDKNISFTHYDKLKVISFSQAMFMNVGFVNDDVSYEYRVDITYYLKILNERKKLQVQLDEKMNA